MATFSLPAVGSTAVPAIQWTPQGPIIPTETDVLAGVQEDINYAFGGGVNPALESPQGQIASSTAAIIADKNAELAYVANQVDPQYATGRFQDALARIYYLTRKGATPTAVNCDLGGLPNTVVPAGTLAQDTQGNTYALLGNVTIGADSTATSSWANLVDGPIPCLANTLTKVYQAIPGWDTINNPSDGSLGQNVETATEFENRRKNSVAINGRGTTSAIYGSVFNVADVLDCYVIDNPSGSTVPTGPTNYPLLPHSIYVAVVGGLDADIARAIWLKKDAGCDYNGNTSVTVVDDSGYNYPQPSYVVKFQRPAALPIKFAVQIANSPSLPPDIITQVQNAIIARFYGTDGSSREREGSTILASRYYTAVGAVSNNAVLVGISVGTITASGPSAAVGIDQYPTLSANNIAVVLV